MGTPPHLPRSSDVGQTRRVHSPDPFPELYRLLWEVVCSKEERGVPCCRSMHASFEALTRGFRTSVPRSQLTSTEPAMSHSTPITFLLICFITGVATRYRLSTRSRKTEGCLDGVKVVAAASHFRLSVQLASGCVRQPGCIGRAQPHRLSSPRVVSGYR